MKYSNLCIERLEDRLAPTAFIDFGATTSDLPHAADVPVCERIESGISDVRTEVAHSGRFCLPKPPRRLDCGRGTHRNVDDEVVIELPVHVDWNPDLVLHNMTEVNLF